MYFTKSLNNNTKSIKKLVLYFTTFFLIFICQSSFAQTSKWNSKPFKNVDSIIKVIESSHNKQLLNYNNDSILVYSYKTRLEFLRLQLEKGFIFYEKGLYSYFDRLKKVLSLRNELTYDHINIFISSSPIPNAFSLGDGNIVFNIGLLHKLQNDDQILFILAHEIAHVLLDHTNQKVLRASNKRDDILNNGEIDSILSRRYNKRKELEEYFKDLFFEEMSFSRKDELAADSLGFELYKETNSPEVQASKTLYLLDSIDKYNIDKKINFEGVFNSVTFTFDEEWLKEESYMFGGTQNKYNPEIDSSKSHPDATLRADIIENMSKNITDTTLDKNQISPYFEFIKYQLKREYVKGWLKLNNYTKALFFSLKLVTREPDNKSYLLELSAVLDEIYSKYKKNNLSKYIDRPSSEQESEYNEITELIDNISLHELEKLNYHFHLKYKSALVENDMFKNRLVKYQKLINNKK